MKLTVLDTSLLLAQRSNMQVKLEEITEVTKVQNIPPYLSLELTKAVNQVVEAVEGAVTLTISGGLVGTIVFGGALSYLVGLIRGLQFQVFIFLIQVSLPGLAHKYFSMMCEIAQIDIFHGEDLNKIIFKFPHDGSFNAHFDQFGYESQNFFLLSGSLIVPLLILTVASYFFYILLNYLAIKNYRSKKCRRVGMWAYNSQFSLKETLITLFTEGFFELQIGQVLNWNFMMTNHYLLGAIFFDGVVNSIPVLIAVMCFFGLGYVCLKPLGVLFIKKGDAFNHYV